MLKNLKIENEQPDSTISGKIFQESNSSVQSQILNRDSNICSASAQQCTDNKPVNLSFVSWTNQQVYLAATLAFNLGNKQRKKQQNLFTLLHSYKCLEINEFCVFENCRTEVREILDHISSCLVIASCSFNFCTASKKILTHWNDCLDDSCEICSPLRYHFSNLINWRLPLKNKSDQNSTRKPLQQINTVQMVTEEDVKQKPIHQIQQSHPIQSNTFLGSAGAVPVKDSNSLIYTQDEMKRVLLATLNKMLTKTPEVIPFRKAVDLKYTDYYEIIKKPMDLSKIQNKLLEDAYSDPWEYIEDVNLMLSNAQLYNKKNSKLFKNTLKISDAFEREISIAMKSLGFCCGQKLDHAPESLYCSGKRNENCQIARNDKYFIYELLTEKPSVFLYCEQCFYELKDGDVSLILPDSTEILVEKLFFRLKTNNVVTPEPFIDCCECTRKFHVVCVRYLSGLWPKGFICDGCLTRKGAKRRTDRFSAHKLPKTTLSEHIETHVNNRLMQMEAGANPVIIRVLSNVTKIIDVKPETLNRLREQETPLAPNFQYQSKGIFAFQKIDGVEVFIFGMFVQEYGSDCQPPNAGRVYLEFLDTVNFFRPRKYRTIVYQDIILSYLDFVTKAGYQWAHVFASSPEVGQDYIFNCHPADQRFPKLKRLQDWYKKLLNKGIQEKIIVNFRNLFDQTIKDKITTVAQLPYFADDHWPKVYEDVALEMKSEEIEELNFQLVGNVTKKRRGFVKKRVSKRIKTELQPASDFDARIFDLMTKNKESFFVIQLHSQEMELNHIIDTVVLKSGPIFINSRDDFLCKCTDEKLEFTNLRHAQFTSMTLLFDLHNFEEFLCNVCKLSIKLRYNCAVCDDYDLCFDCYIITSHPHHLKRIESKICLPNVLTLDETQEYMIGFLIHSYSCKNDNCSLKPCNDWKTIFAHSRLCSVKALGGCSECKNFQLFCCNHALLCLNKNCNMPFCQVTKLKVKNEETRQEELKKNNSVVIRYSSNLPITAQSIFVVTKANYEDNHPPNGCWDPSSYQPKPEGSQLKNTPTRVEFKPIVNEDTTLLQAAIVVRSDIFKILKIVKSVLESSGQKEMKTKIVNEIWRTNPALSAYVEQIRKIKIDAKATP